jgi:hypothetical protein
MLSSCGWLLRSAFANDRGGVTEGLEQFLPADGPAKLSIADAFRE